MRTKNSPNLLANERHLMARKVSEVMGRVQPKCPFNEEQVFQFLYPADTYHAVCKAHSLDSDSVNLTTGVYPFQVNRNLSPVLYSIFPEARASVVFNASPADNALRPTRGYRNLLVFDPNLSAADAEPFIQYVQKVVRWENEKNELDTALEQFIGLLKTKAQAKLLIPSVCALLPGFENVEPANRVPKTLSELTDAHQEHLLHKMARLQSYLNRLIMMPERPGSIHLQPKGSIEFNRFQM